MADIQSTTSNSSDGIISAVRTTPCTRCDGGSIKLRRPAQVITKNCCHCGKVFYTWNRHKIFCCVACRYHRDKMDYRAMGGCTDRSPGNTGAASEALVCADLLFRNVPVFRAMSPSCFCDLIAMTGGKLLRVEVTRGYRAKGGKVYWSKHDESNYDVLALVFSDNSIIYMPDNLPSH